LSLQNDVGIEQLNKFVKIWEPAHKEKWDQGQACRSLFTWVCSWQNWWARNKI